MSIAKFWSRIFKNWTSLHLRQEVRTAGCEWKILYKYMWTSKIIFLIRSFKDKRKQNKEKQNKKKQNKTNKQTKTKQKRKCALESQGIIGCFHVTSYEANNFASYARTAIVFSTPHSFIWETQQNVQELAMLNM